MFGKKLYRSLIYNFVVEIFQNSKLPRFIFLAEE